MPALRALVVEDNPTMRSLIVNALSRIRGMRVDEAANGVEALQKLAPPAWFDIILTDVNMPVMDGLKLVQRVRADAYIAKPIQSTQVIDIVSQLLGIAVAGRSP